MKLQPNTLLRRATTTDVQAITACITATYRHYIERIGQAPAPMFEDYRATVETHEVYVSEVEEHIVAVLVLAQMDEGFLLDNIAVAPSCQGKGIGRQLLAFAEQRAIETGYDSIYLYTNEAMTENLRMYAKIGYVEFARRTEKGLSRVYMRKHLSTDDD